MTKLWGGRFVKKTNKLVEDFSKSIHFDYKLAKADCIGSLCHIEVLKKTGLLTTNEHRALKDGLSRILQRIGKGCFKIDQSFEDIHSYIQHLLEKDPKVKEVALKLHTCRSRNDQIVFDTKLYCLEQGQVTIKLLQILQTTLKQLSTKNKSVIMPGFTHLQHAIPIKASDWFKAYKQMFARDEKRLQNALGQIELTLGSGALAGTFIPTSKYSVFVKKLKVSAPKSAIDTVSDRDFILEILSALSIAGVHLSRLSEDLIMWCSQEFDFIDIDDAFCTGSSLMPQKKNPDVLELIRGAAGKLIGNLTSVVIVLKGLPLSYNRDLQMDKEPLFDSIETMQMILSTLTELLKNIKFNTASLRYQLYDESLYATDIADYLVQKGVVFKTAHAIVGKLIRKKLASEINILDMSTEMLKAFHPALTPKVLKNIINPTTSVNSKKSIKE